MALSPLISELEDAVKHGSSERRVQMLRQVTDLFLSDTDRFNEQQISVFDDVLLHLVERVETRALTQLSLTFSDLDRAPKEVVRQLAYHEEIDVAAPVLTKSNRLSDSDLADIASKRGQQHLLAISHRETLNEVVTDVLIKRGDSSVSHVLAQNAGARFSQFGYSTLVNNAEQDESLAEKLGLRIDIPLNILRDLLRRATETARSRLMQMANPEVRDRIRSVVDEVAKDLDGTAVAKADYERSRSVVLELNRAGQLNEAAINRFVLHHEHANTIMALSLLTAAAVDAIEPLFYNQKPDGLLVACRAAKLSWNTTLTMLRNRSEYSPGSQLDIEQNKKIFEALSQSSAQRTLRFWAARSAAKKQDAPETPVAMAGV